VRLPKPIITSTGKPLSFIAGTQAQTWLVRLPKPIITSTGKPLSFIAGTQAQTWLIVSEKTLFDRLAAMVSPALGMRNAL